MNINRQILALTIIGLLALVSTSFTGDNSITVLDNEAQIAFKYLNEFRQNPAEYGKKIKLNLKKVDPRPKLVWNDTLAKVAVAKATDMAKRNYFKHVTPDGQGINIMIYNAGYKMPEYYLKPKTSNFFESIGAGVETGKEMIDLLITDKGTPSLGHRKHLLGIDDGKYPFNSLLVDVGIGFVKTDKKKNNFNSYMSVIIAFHGKKED